MYLYRHVHTTTGVLFIIFSIQASTTADVDHAHIPLLFRQCTIHDFLNAVFYIVSIVSANRSRRLFCIKKRPALKRLYLMVSMLALASELGDAVSPTKDYYPVLPK